MPLVSINGNDVRPEQSDHVELKVLLDKDMVPLLTESMLSAGYVISSATVGWTVDVSFIVVKSIAGNDVRPEQRFHVANILYTLDVSSAPVAASGVGNDVRPEQSDHV
jgi:hypothetical protein